MFDRSDPARVKKVLGDTLCTVMGVPVSMLQMGTSQQVKDYCKQLIDVCGKDGGFIMTANTVIDEANPELVRVWVEFTKEYGTYR